MARFLSVSLVLIPLLVASAASADIIPPGYKGAKSSIQVTAQVPQGSVILLANTFPGVTALEPGKTQKVSWHPLHGKMELVLAKRDQLDQLKELPRDTDKRWEAIRKHSTRCSEPFDGVRTIKDSEPYNEVRWYYEVNVEGEKCSAKLIRTAYLEDDKEVSSDPPSSLPPGTSASSPPTKSDAKTDAKPESKGCNGCATAGAPSKGQAAWLALPLTVLWWRRKHRT